MQSRRTRLDRFISVRTGVGKGDVRLLLAQGRVTVDKRVATDISQVIDQFSHVTLDGEVLQANVASYVMLNKPMGVVSASSDTRHKTVIDCLNRADKATLHHVGRLDFNTTGLLLLSNDGAWLRNIIAPESKLQKVYSVTVERPIAEHYIEAFANGMYFSYEGIHTRPATLRITSKYTAQVALTEGRYHQIKRMFGRFDNRVLALHRTSIGGLELDSQLTPGDSRDLTPGEVRFLGQALVTNQSDSRKTPANGVN